MKKLIVILFLFTCSCSTAKVNIPAYEYTVKIPYREYFNDGEWCNTLAKYQDESKLKALINILFKVLDSVKNSNDKKVFRERIFEAIQLYNL